MERETERKRDREKRQEEREAGDTQLPLIPAIMPDPCPDTTYGPPVIGQPQNRVPIALVQYRPLQLCPHHFASYAPYHVPHWPVL